MFLFHSSRVKYAEREWEREREIGALCFHLANERTLTSLGKTVTGCLHKVRWKWSYFLPFFVERVGSGDMTKLRGI